MSIEQKVERLFQGVRDDAALRRVRRMQPVGGPGDKIFPPTYPGAGKNDPPRHVFEHRRVDGENVLCVLIDSVQSQANRLEEALQALRSEGRVKFPVIAVDFEGTEVGDLGRITALEAPHRVFDAIIRDSELDGKRFFKETEEGRRLLLAKADSARAVFELAPHALAFGAWNSTGEGGGLGAKFPRAIVSEIIGVGVAVEPVPGREKEQRPSGQRPGSRIDPLGIRSGVKVFKTPDNDWSFEKTKGAKEVKPSETNHSNIAPTVQPLGVTVDYALHTFVISMAALRRIRLDAGSRRSSEADEAARVVLAAMALVAATAQDRVGYFLRSRCDLVPEPGSSSDFEIVRADGSTEPFPCTLDDATALFGAAVERAGASGVSFRESDLVLRPQEKLVRLVAASREQALQGLADEEPQQG